MVKSGSEAPTTAVAAEAVAEQRRSSQWNCIFDHQCKDKKEI